MTDGRDDRTATAVHRVAHITAPARYGGLEKVVASLARETAGLGHRVILVMVLEPQDAVPEWALALEADGVALEPVFVSTRAYRRERHEVRAILQRHAATVVHTHGFRSDIVHAGTARSLGIPVVSTAHGFAATDLRSRLYEWLQVRRWHRFDAVIAVSEVLRQRLLQERLASNRVVYIRNALSRPAGATLSREEARMRLGLPAAGDVVGWVGRLSQEKDPEHALHAFAALSRSAHLCFVGDGPLRHAVEEAIRARGLQARVHLVGAVPNAAELLTAFDVLLLSSRTEGTPMVVLEAATQGIPIVATAVGGVPDLVGTDGAALVPAGDVPALATSLQQVLADRSQAASRAQRLQGRLLVEADGAEWARRHLSLYESLTGSPS